MSTTSVVLADAGFSETLRPGMTIACFRGVKIIDPESTISVKSGCESVLSLYLS